MDATLLTIGRDFAITAVAACIIPIAPDWLALCIGAAVCAYGFARLINELRRFYRDR